uniref:Serine (or cysteine) proteinase inhibitor, clade A, member 3K n=1 Tax=Xenopus tropicalis TaxID=8364 RepID=A0A6I8T1N9_XENTR
MLIFIMRAYFLFVSISLLCAVVFGDHEKHHESDHKEHGDHGNVHHHSDEKHTDDSHGDHHHDESMPCLKIAPYNANFGFSLYRQIAADHPTENIFISPVSISTVFAMLSLGARSNTLNQIIEGLKFNRSELTEEEMHKGFQHLLHMLNDPNSKVQLNSGNALFIDKDLQLIQKFVEDSKQFYEAETFSTDFHNTEEATKQINTYAENKTKGKITDLISSVDEKTILVLINYIYFYGEWESPFSPDFTRLSVFSIDNRTKVEVKMMSRMGRFDIFLDNELPCTVLKLPYIDDALMLLIMPELGKIQEVEAALSKDTILRWRNSTSKKFLRLYMPKFSISSSLKLKEILSDVGMSNIFSDQADFSGIVEDGKLTLSKVIHKAVLDVDEKGTEAAAVTAVNVIRYSLLKSQKVDRPFLVVICSKQTDTILFMGRIVNPTEK